MTLHYLNSQQSDQKNKKLEEEFLCKFFAIQVMSVF